MRIGSLDIRWGKGATEARTSPESPTWSISDLGGWQGILDQWNSAAGPAVTEKTALGVPAFWAAVNFLSTMIAVLPFHEFKRTANGGRERVTTGMIAGMLAGTVNDEALTSFKWRKGRMVSALLTGAGRTWVEKDAGGKPVNLWPLETGKTTKRRVSGATVFKYQISSSKVVTYTADEVIDVTFLDQLDGLGVYNPIERMRNTLGLAIALQEYASRFFANGGVPPLAMHTPLGSPSANSRAKSDTDAAIRAANADKSNVLLLPLGTELKAVGFNPEQGQLVEAQRFIVEEIARLTGLPPVFLQDLTHGTYSNTEQQDLHLTKHVAAGWVGQWEGECNAKFYGPRNASRFVEMNLDGLQRGAFKDRVEAYARGIQTGQITPAEVRRAENRREIEGSDRLFIQGATVPLEKAGEVKPAPAPPADPAADPTEGEPAQ
jgi:HK97 family phage portal protein